MLERDSLTGLTSAQMLVRDQQAQQEGFSTWWVLLLIPVVIVWVLVDRGPRMKP